MAIVVSLAYLLHAGFDMCGFLGETLPCSEYAWIGMQQI